MKLIMCLISKMYFRNWNFTFVFAVLLLISGFDGLFWQTWSLSRCWIQFLCSTATPLKCSLTLQLFFWTAFWLRHVLDSVRLWLCAPFVWPPLLSLGLRIWRRCCRSPPTPGSFCTRSCTPARLSCCSASSPPSSPTSCTTGKRTQPNHCSDALYLLCLLPFKTRETAARTWRSQQQPHGHWII